MVCAQESQNETGLAELTNSISSSQTKHPCCSENLACRFKGDPWDKLCTCLHRGFSSFDGFRTCDAIKADGSFYTWSDLQVKGLHSKSFLSWHGLIDAIPVKWKTS